MDGKPLDLSALDTSKAAEEGFTLQLVHPDGTLLPGKIKVQGVDSDAYQQAFRAQQRRAMDRLNRSGKFKATPEQLEAERIEILVRVTIGWEAIALNGEALPFNADNAKMIYTRYPLIREQVDQAVNDRGNFLPSSASS